MIALLKSLFKQKPEVDFKNLVENGAIILDVRTVAEYKAGHISSSINIPVQELDRHLSKLKKNSTIITCCASGIRSGSAVNILKSAGHTDVYNGGSWSSLQDNLL